MKTDFERIVHKFEICYSYLDAMKAQRIGGATTKVASKPKVQQHGYKLEYYWSYLHASLTMECNLVSVCCWDLERECNDRSIARAPANRPVLAQFELAIDQFVCTRGMSIINNDESIQQQHQSESLVNYYYLYYFGVN